MQMQSNSPHEGRVSSCKTTIKKQCHSERSEDGLLRTPSEKSRVHKVGVTEILRYALDDKMIGNFYYDTPSYFIYISEICKESSIDQEACLAIP